MKIKNMIFAFMFAAAVFTGCSSKQNAVSYDADNVYQVAAYGDEKAVKKIVSKGMSVNERDENGFTPLYYAVLGEPKVYADALDSIIAAFKKDNDDAVYEALRSAPVVKGNVQALSALIKNGANITLKDRNDRSAFLYAALFCSDVNVLQVLLEAGCDTAETITINKPQNLMAFASFTNTNPEVISFLAKKTGDIDKPNTMGTTPIMWACMYNSNPAVIEALIKAGADINDARHNSGKSPLDWAILCNREPSVVDYIRKAGGISLKPKYAEKDLGKKSVQSYSIGNKNFDMNMVLSEITEYDNNGCKKQKVSKRFGELSRTSYECDSNGNVILERRADNHNITYKYDSKGNVIKKIWKSYWSSYSGDGTDGIFEYKYDSKGRLIWEKCPGDYSSTYDEFVYKYDANGKLIDIESPTGAPAGIENRSKSYDIDDEQKRTLWHFSFGTYDTGADCTFYEYDFYDAQKTKIKAVYTWMASVDSYTSDAGLSVVRKLAEVQVQ